MNASSQAKLKKYVEYFDILKCVSSSTPFNVRRLFINFKFNLNGNVFFFYTAELIIVVKFNGTLHYGKTLIILSVCVDSL